MIEMAKWYHRTNKKETENFSEISKKESVFRNGTERDLIKIKNMINKKIYEKNGVENVYKVKRCSILRTTDNESNQTSIFI